MLCLYTRPDSGYSVSLLSIYQNNPSQPHSEDDYEVSEIYVASRVSLSSEHT